MAIKIVEGPTIELTAEEYNRYSAEYEKAFMFYSGVPPTFEEWVRQKKSVNESKQLLNE